MTRYDNLDEFKNVPDSEKISLLRMEMIPLLATIKGYATVIKQKLAEDGQVKETEEIHKWLSNIIEASEDLNALRQILVEKSE